MYRYLHSFYFFVILFVCNVLIDFTVNLLIKSLTYIQWLYIYILCIFNCHIWS